MHLSLLEFYKEFVQVLDLLPVEIILITFIRSTTQNSEIEPILKRVSSLSTSSESVQTKKYKR